MTDSPSDSIPDPPGSPDPAQPATLPTDEAPVPEPREPATPPTAEPVDRAFAEAVQRPAAAGPDDIADSVTDTPETLQNLTEAVVRRVQGMADTAVQQWRNREAARVRHLRSLNRQPLPCLFEVYPEARDAARRELGLAEIPVDEIRGTAVEGPDQRGGDFLPLPAFRSTNWAGRWQRVRQAQAQLVTLPPIDLLKAGGGYWVVDGHNRVAVALYAGQLEVDATVIVLRLPGDVTDDPAASLAPLRAEMEEMRAAGMGSRMPNSPTTADP